MLTLERVDRGGPGFVGGRLSPYRAIGLLKNKFAEILEIFGNYRHVCGPCTAGDVSAIRQIPPYRPDTCIDCK